MCVPLPLIGGIVSGVGSAIGAIQSANAYKAQAKFHERQAEMERDKGAFDAARQTERARQILGQQVANYSASGIQIDGSAADVIADTGSQAALDVGAIRYGADIRSSNERFEAQMARTNARGAQVGAVFGFASPIIDSATSMARAYG